MLHFIWKGWKSLSPLSLGSLWDVQVNFSWICDWDFERIISQTSNFWNIFNLSQEIRWSKQRQRWSPRLYHLLLLARLPLVLRLWGWPAQALPLERPVRVQSTGIQGTLLHPCSIFQSTAKNCSGLEWQLKPQPTVPSCTSSWPKPDPYSTLPSCTTGRQKPGWTSVEPGSTVDRIIKSRSAASSCPSCQQKLECEQVVPSCSSSWY